jgi:hypothetical protein
VSSILQITSPESKHTPKNSLKVAKPPRQRKTKAGGKRATILAKIDSAIDVYFAAVQQMDEAADPEVGNPFPDRVEDTDDLDHDTQMDREVIRHQDKISHLRFDKAQDAVFKAETHLEDLFITAHPDEGEPAEDVVTRRFRRRGDFTYVCRKGEAPVILDHRGEAECERPAGQPAQTAPGRRSPFTGVTAMIDPSKLRAWFPSQGGGR